MANLRRIQRFLCGVSLDMKCMYKSFLPALVGLCLGITISMMYAPFSDDSCETFVANQDPQKMIKLRDTDTLDSVETELYEPRQLAQVDESGNSFKSDAKQQTRAKLMRPKFAATELGIRQKLFVAVMSSKDTLNTLGVALNKTLSHYVTKIVFFIDTKVDVVPPGMMIVNFADGYNHLIPINVFKYVIKKYGADYDYFMFVTDKAYIRGENVFDMVSLISVSQHVHLGAPKGVENGRTFCSLDAGVILSQSILTLVNNSLKWCDANCHHLDQTLNFGKCLSHVTEVECQNKVGNKFYKTHQVNNFDFNKDIVALKENMDFNASMSVYPVTSELTHFKLHRYFCEVELNITRHEIQKMKENILYMAQFAPGGRESVSWPVGVPESYKAKNRFDVIRWDYFTETHIFFQDDFTNVKELIGVDKLDIQDIIKVSIEKLNEKHNNKYLYSYLVNGYRRFDPQRGMEYILDFALEDTSMDLSVDDLTASKASRVVHKRVFLVRPLGEVEVVPMPYVMDTTKLNLVLPVMVSDLDSWGTFLESYVKLYQTAKESLGIIIVFVYPNKANAEDQQDVFSVPKSMVSYYNEKNNDGIGSVVYDFYSNGTQVSELQIMDMVSRKMPLDSLLFMCSVGMELRTEFLNRARINAIRGWQVFFPIGFWQFKPNIIYEKKPYPAEVDFNSRTGHYDVLSYEHGSFYNSDYAEARRNLMQQDPMDVDVYEMFVRYGKLHVFRAVEPEFRHHYRQLQCDDASHGKLQERCRERRAQGLGSRAQLAKRVFEYRGKKGGLQSPPH